MELLKTLCDSPSVSGNEANISKIVQRELRGKVDEMRTDAFGNVFTRKGKGKPRVMLAAHMDETGLMVKYIDDNGFIKFAPVGGWNDQILLGQRVTIHGDKGDLIAVAGSKPIHMMSEDERKTPVKMDKMFLDAGFSSRKEVEKAGISVGNWASVRFPATKMGKLFTGKALDNRAGVVALIEFMKKVKPKCEVYGVFTVQEEVGLKGARITAFDVTPDIGISVDTTLPGDIPGVEKHESAVELGKGPVITLADGSKDCVGSGLMANRVIVDWLTSTAKKGKIPYQKEVIGGGTTDATAISLSKSGVPSVGIGIPVRYLHTPVEVVDLRDIANTVELLLQSMATVPKL
ncbi:MAG: M42 family metallopeptidase [archaeon]